MGNKIVRRLTAAILTGVMLFTYTACNKASVPDATSSSERKSHDSQKTAEYIVDNEDKAQKVITCPDDNILGLEKIVLFENRMTAVFDKKTSDNSDGFFKKGNKGIEYLWFSFNNLSPMETKYDLTKEDGRYILEASCQYDASDLIDPEREVKITRLFIKGKNESINLEIYADDLEVNLVTLPEREEHLNPVGKLAYGAYFGVLLSKITFASIVADHEGVACREIPSHFIVEGYDVEFRLI